MFAKSGVVFQDQLKGHVFVLGIRGVFSYVGLIDAVMWG